MHNYNSQRKGKKSECLCSNWMPPYLKFVNTFLVIHTLLLNFLCGWKLSSHPTISENYDKKKTTSFKVYVAFFLPFFFLFIFWVTLVVPLYLLQHLSYTIFNFNLTVVGHHIHRELFGWLFEFSFLLCCTSFFPMIK